MSLVDTIVRSYLRRNPDVSDAMLTDPLCSTRLKLTRQVLEMVDTAMRGEGISEEVRGRILDAVIYGRSGYPSAEVLSAAQDRLVVERPEFWLDNWS